MKTVLVICAILQQQYCDQHVIYAVDGLQPECKEWAEIKVDRIDPMEILKKQYKYKGCIIVDADEYLEVK